MDGPCAGPLGVRGVVGTGDILNTPSGGFGSHWKLSLVCPVKNFCSTQSQISRRAERAPCVPHAVWRKVCLQSPIPQL